MPFEEAKSRFISQWQRPQRHLLPLERQSGDGGRLLRSSYNMLLAHEDKQFPGALIASLSIPWGEAKNDEDTGGYHLVWPRDMVNSATGLLAAGQSETAYRAMIYLAASQNEDGGFAQNFWIDGKPYWHGLQLDEIAYPLLLVRQLQRVGALRGFDPCSLVTRAARFLVLNGPVTGQERWEEASGLSPSTLAAIIAGLISAASFLRGVGDESDAIFLEDYADWLESNLDLWCATDQGCLVEGEARHYVRIFPLQPGQFLPATPPRDEPFDLTSQEPGARKTFAAKEVFDGGFLEFVRYGIRAADAPLVRASVRVMDKVLRCETPRGTCFWRYNGDGYGQRDDGTPYHDHWGVGAPGRFWAASEGTTKSPPAATPQSTSNRWKVSPRLRDFCPNKSGMRPICPKRTWKRAARPARRGLWRGRTPNTSNFCAPSATAKSSTASMKPPRATSKAKSSPAAICCCGIAITLRKPSPPAQVCGS